MSNKKKSYRNKPPVKKKKSSKANSVKSVLSACLILVIGGGLCFVGYSVVVPVFEYFSNKSISDSVKDSSQNDKSSSSDDNSSKEDSSGDNISSKAEVTTSQVEVTTPPEQTTQAEVTTNAVTTVAPVSVGNAAGYTLSVNALKSTEALEAELAGLVNTKYSSVIVPLKQSGGGLMYASKIRLAQLAQVVDSKVSLKDIASTITKLGYEPVAEINLLDDNRYPLVQKKSAYQFADGITGSWLDAKKDEGGKPWISPFSEITKNYVKALAEEISGAGFTKIVCTGVHFPAFREKDFGYIGELVTSADRYKGLTGIVNTVGNNVASGTTIMLRVSAREAVDGTCEVLKPNELAGIAIMPFINFDSFSGSSPSEKITSVMSQLETACGGLTVVPCIEKGSINESQLESVVAKLAELGYKSYYIS